MIRLLYTATIWLYGLIVRMVAPFNTKAVMWIRGRRESRQRIAETDTGWPWLWFHAASLGEFEQGRPVIEAIRKAKPQYRILLSFFSPSGFEIRKDYPQADLVIYLPEDKPSEIRRHFDQLDLRAVFFIKYEFWYNLLNYLHKRQVPFYFFSVRFRPGQHFFRWYGRWFVAHLRPARHLFVQDNTSLHLLRKAGFEHCSIAGDTRFDRVAQLVEEAPELPEIADFVQQQPLFVAGSTWPADERLLLPLLTELPDNYKIIIAPHDISQNHVRSIREACPLPAVTYSERENLPGARIMIIDNIGMLSRIYRYARFAYIGGGFGRAIHNIQEPVAWGRPVIIGPKHEKFTEALDLVRLGGAFAVHNSSQLRAAMLRLATNEDALAQASEICRRYVADNLGATQRILEKLDI
ncbi:MAG: 3-deoxy-D-manno-octulosonic acid transferase [Bacteroidetes bacterium]|nr:3-deoxy-D-manno-octulosonic acid transferase [Bacteroidota bacterium]